MFQNNFLIGIEADIAGINADRKKDGHWAGGVDNGYPINASYKNAASLRGRVGHVFNQDSTLAFITDGAAFARIKNELFNSNGTSVTDEDFHTANGWTAGFGIEQVLPSVLTLKAEYIYSDYGTHQLMNTTYCGGGPTCYDKFKEKNDSVRVGIHYRF